MKPKCLIVEDDSMSRKLYRKIVGSMDIEIDYEVENGADAIEKIIEDDIKYDFILMDVKMPHINGVEAYRVIKDFIDGPIIFITGDPSIIKFSGIDIINCEILEKPINVKKLIDLINNILK